MIFRKLTDRQADVLRLICKGRTDQEIAQDLQLMVGTARQYRYNIQQRLGGADFADICREVEERPAAKPTNGIPRR